MAWDSSRTVPWKRLLVEWAVVATVLGVYFAVTRKVDANLIAAIPVSLVTYVGFGGILAKFGYQRKTMKQLRVEGAAKGIGRASAPTSGATPKATTTVAARNRPAPTRRTSSGPNNRPRHTAKGRRR